MNENLPADLARQIESAKVLASSDLLPSSLRGKPANVVLIAEMAKTLGLPPMTGLTQIAIVDGKPTLSASLQAALVRKAGHRLTVIVNDQELTATATLVRSDDPETRHQATWTQAKAELAGLWGRGAWSKYPGAMLAARATTEVIRLAASDVLLGGWYDGEELAPAGPSEALSAPESVEVDADEVEVLA